MTARAEVAAIFDRLERTLAGRTKGAGEGDGDGVRPAGRGKASPALPRESAMIRLPDYVVEAPDILNVEAVEFLPGRPITGEHLVRPDGRISLGFYGTVEVAGLTTEQIKEKVILHLRDFLSDEALGLKRADPATGKVEALAPRESSRVSVEVTSYNSKVYYVLGAVRSPGRLPVTGNETVLDAINYAGGFLPGEETPIVYLVRPSPPGSGVPERVLRVDFRAIVEWGDVTTNYQLMPGDRLLVTPWATTVPAGANPPPGPADARMDALERKLDLILKKLDGAGKP